jgi:hypothetical protein
MRPQGFSQFVGFETHLWIVGLLKYLEERYIPDLAATKPPAACAYRSLASTYNLTTYEPNNTITGITTYWR